MNKKQKNARKKWHTVDLHIHTPATSDYQQSGVSYLDILQQAEKMGLDVIAFTDHNTVAGYRQMKEEIQQLELLKKLDRLLLDEKARLKEYKRLYKKILVLPGFEFTATLGFHILCIFSPNKPVREIEHLLINLHIPPEQLDEGSATVGAATDVLSAYEIVNKAGGIVIAAHANSTNGVAMRGFSFGGQTKIAYTQDPNLHALEVTDLERKGRRTTSAFFNGTKPEYPRRMHCIQGSDAHRLETDPNRKKNLGIGDRATDLRLHEVSFNGLLQLFKSNDFTRTHPHRPTEQPTFDFIQAAREEGSNIVQDFHEGITVRGGRRYAVIADVCAFANTNGGTLFVGVSNDPRKSAAGASSPQKSISLLEKEISSRISPPLNCTLDIHKTQGKSVIRILIPRGEDPPYALDDNKIYVRSEAETGLAVRDEIVGLVRGKKKPAKVKVPVEDKVGKEKIVKAREPDDHPPRVGVEVAAVEKRNGREYFTMRDLRNGNVVKNVTKKSARRLWHYAITRYSKYPKDFSKADVKWHGKLGVVRKYKQAKRSRYDLVQKTPKGNRYYFGVTDDGIHGPWKKLIGLKDD